MMIAIKNLTKSNQFFVIINQANKQNIKDIKIDLNKHRRNMAQNQSCFKKFLAAIDVFSYVPVPQAYPVSTNKSKIGSVLFLCILLGYLIWDFYNFITNNIPTTNAYQQNSINRGNISIPAFAFGVLYSDPIPTSPIQYIVNDNAYFKYTFESMLSRVYPNGTTNTTYTKLPLCTCSNSSWQSALWSNLTCINFTAIAAMNMSYPVIGSDGKLMISEWIVDNVRYNYYFRLRLAICSNYSTCADNISSYIGNTVFILYSKQPRGYNFREGTAVESSKPNTMLYLFQNSTSSSVGLYITPISFVTSPNLLTQFQKTVQNYSMITRSAITNYTYKAVTFALRLYWYPEYVMDVVQIHQQTIIDRVSQWSAFASLIFMIAAICFLGYNRKKFNRRNPDWERFDQMLKEKLEVEMQPLGNSAKPEQSQREGQSEPQKPIDNSQDKQNEIFHKTQVLSQNNKIRQNLMPSPQHQRSIQKIDNSELHDSVRILSHQNKQ